MQTAAHSGLDAPASSWSMEGADTKPRADLALPLQTDMSGIDDSIADNLEPSTLVMAAVDATALTDPKIPITPPKPNRRSAVCTIKASAIVEAAAMVRLVVKAPCLPNEYAVVHHNGMMFSAVTDDVGALTQLVPALSETAVLMVEFANGEGVVAQTDVASLMYYERVVLQWTGDSGFGLHAREFDAEYGSAGHVWSGAARDVTTTAMGEGGFITRLGESYWPAPKIAEVYTFPTGATRRGGTVDLSVEAEVTAQNCGQDIEAQAIEVPTQGTPRTRYLTLAVPDCSTIGDFLVLNNLLDDLKIAAN